MENAESAKEWYVTHEGKQFGPVTIDDLKYEAERGKLNPRLDMVWKSDMEDWIPAGDIEGLFEKNEKAAVEEKVKESAIPSPFQPEESKKDRLKMEGKWGGTSRGAFLLITYILPFFFAVGVSLGLPLLLGKVDQNSINLMVGIAGLVMFIMIIFVSINRFPNLGMSRWWWFGLMVPLLSLWVTYRMVACPEGYADHKKLDVFGWMIAILYWLFILIVVLLTGALVFYAMQSPEEFKTLETPQEVVDHFRKNLGF